MPAQCPLWVISDKPSRAKTRLCPELSRSGQTPVRSECPLCANSGHRQPHWITSSAPGYHRIRWRKADSRARLSSASQAVTRRTADHLQDLGGRRLLLQRLVQPVLERRNLLVCIGGRLTTASNPRRIAALQRQRLTASRFNCCAACFVAPSHCRPLGSRTEHCPDLD